MENQFTATILPGCGPSVPVEAVRINVHLEGEVVGECWFDHDTGRYRFLSNRQLDAKTYADVVALLAASGYQLAD